MARSSGVILDRSPTRKALTRHPMPMRMRAAATPSPPLLPGPHSTPTQGTLLRAFSSARALAMDWSRSCSLCASSRSSPPTRTAMGPSALPMTPSSSSSRPTRFHTALATA